MEDEKQVPEPQQYQQPYQQPVQQQYFKVNNSEQKYIRAIQFGILMIMLGFIISISVQGFSEIQTGSYYGMAPTYDDWVQKAVTVGGIIYYIGLTVLLLGMISLALLAKEMHMHMKIALIIGFAIVFGTGINSWSMFTFSFPYF